MSNLPVPSTPPDRPRSLAKKNIYRVHDVVYGEIVPEPLPAPHLDPKASLDRGYVGLSTEQERDDSTGLFVRIPNRVLERLYNIVSDERFPYRRNTQAFIRHAIYELLRAIYLSLEDEEGAPETVQYLKSQQMLKKSAFRSGLILEQEANFRSDEVFLAHAVERGQTQEVHQRLDDIAGLYTSSPSQTWRIDYQGLIARSAAVQRAVKHVIEAWTGHKDTKKRQNAARWESWWAAMTED